MKVALLCLLLCLTGCAADISPDSYSVGAVGQTNRAVAGTVVAAREGSISGSSGAGGTIGAAMGAGAGYALAFRDAGPARIVVAAGAAIVGGVIGAVAESAATKTRVMEYVVQTENGNYMTIVQDTNPTFTVGQRVFVLYSSPSRLVADLRTLPVVPVPVAAIAVIPKVSVVASEPAAVSFVAVTPAKVIASGA